jgi:hypothetical protein
MRYRSLSRLLYRNVLIAAGLAAALGASAAPVAAVAAQPHGDEHQPDGSADAAGASRARSPAALATQPRMDVTLREPQR